MNLDTENKPVFIRGMSRSGGTFTCTMLDAHPQLAISYELYPRLVELDGSVSEQRAVLMSLHAALSKATLIKKISVSEFPTDKFRLFFVRLERGGVTVDEAAELVKAEAEFGIDLRTREGRGRFVEQCCRIKSEKSNKPFWGCKMNNDIDLYLELWPRAKCIDVVRDGRDMAASQLGMGTFGKTIEQMAISWNKLHQKFLRYQSSHPDNVRVLRYEDLVYNSESSVKELCNFLEIEFSDKMLNYHKEDLTLFKANHVSKKNVMSGINSKSVGKWKSQLSEDEALRFYEIAGDTLNYFNYET